jgi:nanoRNase/pAp phosphatase (c-di-AMP/oligoRNAs hydrolase)
MNHSTEKKLEKLELLMERKHSLLIVLQNYPDPDAIASAAALRELGHELADLTCTIISGGFIGRSENRALMKYLDLPYHPEDDWPSEKADLVALVDTQPGTGNNILPVECSADIVIDHHPIKRETRSAEFHDVRNNYGATSTIMLEYLQAAEIQVSRQLATGLLYGIRSDTQDLGRESSRADIDAVVELYPLANKRMLAEIANSKAPREYLAALQVALANARIYGNAVVSNIGQSKIPEAVSEAADTLLRLEDIEWSFCSVATGKKLLFSIRTCNPENNSGDVATAICKDLGAGGGHQSMAGGIIDLSQIKRRSIERTTKEVEKRFLNQVKQTHRGIHLCGNDKCK